jgi:hypothetical protein
MGLPALNPFLVEKFPEQRQPRYVPSEQDFWKGYEQAEGQDEVMLLVTFSWRVDVQSSSAFGGKMWTSGRAGSG